MILIGRRRLASFGVGALAVGGFLAIQDVDGTAFGQTDATAPPPADCTLASLTLPLFDATPAAALAAPATPVPANAGEPADEATVEEITDTVWETIACTNTGQPGLAFASFSERYLASLFTGDDPRYQPAFERSIDQGGLEPAEADWLTLVEVRDIRSLPDGRATAVVVTESTTSAMAISITESGTTRYEDRLVFVQVDDQWLIDEVLPVDEEGGTPAA